MLLHVYDFLGFAKTLAEKANLNMEFTHSKHTANTHGTTIYIPYPKSSWKEEDVVRWKFMIYHECYHNQPENKADLQIPIIHNFKTNSLLGMIFNEVIDHNIELREFNKGYEGANRAMEEFYKLRVDSIRNKSLYNVRVDEKNAATLATILYAFDCRFEWLLQAYKQDLSPFISNKVLKYYEASCRPASSWCCLMP